MSKAYREIMENVQVTDEMKKRILEKIEEEEITSKSKGIKWNHWKRYLPVAACLVILGAVALPRLVPQVDRQQEEDTILEADIAELGSVSELSEQLGFEISDVSSLPFRVNQTEYYSYWEKFGEIDYTGDTNSAMYRKSKEQGDNSGDFNEYTDVITVKENGIKITLKGEHQKYKLAIWQKGEFSYSLSFEKGIDKDTFISVITGIE